MPTTMKHDGVIPACGIPADPVLVEAAVQAMRDSPGGIGRLVTSQYFTFYDQDGEDAVVTDELLTAIETRLGCPLVARYVEGLEGQESLLPSNPDALKIV